MKINSNDYRVKPDKKLKLAEWPTIGKPGQRIGEGNFKLRIAKSQTIRLTLSGLHHARNRIDSANPALQTDDCRETQGRFLPAVALFVPTRLRNRRLRPSSYGRYHDRWHCR
jgi:hypothetical protein